MSQDQFTADQIPLPSIDPDKTLGEARADLRAALFEGELLSCPCCAGSAKVYSRAITGTMVRVLKMLAESRVGMDNAAIIAATRQSGGGNTSLMAHWGLADKTAEGRWYATARGRLFLSGAIRVPWKVVTYNNIVLGFDVSRQVTARDVAGENFSFTETLAPESITEAVVEAAA